MLWQTQYQFPPMIVILSVDIADLLYTFSATDDHKPKPFIFLSQVLLLFLFVMLLINNYWCYTQRFNILFYLCIFGVPSLDGQDGTKGHKLWCNQSKWKWTKMKRKPLSINSYYWHQNTSHLCLGRKFVLLYFCGQYSSIAPLHFMLTLGYYSHYWLLDLWSSCRRMYFTRLH